MLLFCKRSHNNREAIRHLSTPYASSCFRPCNQSARNFSSWRLVWAVMLPPCCTSPHQVLVLDLTFVRVPGCLPQDFASRRGQLGMPDLRLPPCHWDRKEILTFFWRRRRFCLIFPVEREKISFDAFFMASLDFFAEVANGAFFIDCRPFLFLATIKLTIKLNAMK